MIECFDIAPQAILTSERTPSLDSAVTKALAGLVRTNIAADSRAVADDPVFHAKSVLSERFLCCVGFNERLNYGSFTPAFRSNFAEAFSAPDTISDSFMPVIFPFSSAIFPFTIT